MPIIHYDSVQAFEKSLPEHYRDACDDRPWLGGLTYEACRKAVYEGDSECLERSDKLLERVESDGIELTTAQWENSRTGFIPCVPSFLAGSPESMRRLENVPSDISPVRIYVDLFLSASFTVQEAEMRGAMLLALARKLSIIRPVELYVLMSCGKSSEEDGWISPMIRLETSPLDLATVSFVLGHPGFVRNLCFGWCVKQGASGTIPVFRYAKERVNPEENDLFITNALMTRDVLADPVAWVNNQVKKYTNNLEDFSCTS